LFASGIGGSLGHGKVSNWQIITQSKTIIRLGHFCKYDGALLLGVITDLIWKKFLLDLGGGFWAVSTFSTSV
jgi:hypothetical protein